MEREHRPYEHLWRLTKLEAQVTVQREIPRPAFIYLSSFLLAVEDSTLAPRWGIEGYPEIPYWSYFWWPPALFDRGRFFSTLITCFTLALKATHPCGMRDVNGVPHDHLLTLTLLTRSRSIVGARYPLWRVCPTTHHHLRGQLLDVRFFFA